jgi:hypothetical protein
MSRRRNAHFPTNRRNATSRTKMLWIVAFETHFSAKQLTNRLFAMNIVQRHSSGGRQ